MFSSGRILALLAVPVLVALAGCASAPRTPEADVAIRSVAVVSVVNEDMPVDKLGLTVFNNKTAIIPMGSQLNLELAQQLEARLRAKRPGWEIRDARAESVALQSVVKAPQAMFESREGRLLKQVTPLASKLGVDALLVIRDWSGDGPYSTGIGALYRSITLAPSRSVFVRNNIVLQLLDRQGNSLAITGGEANLALSTSPESLGIDSDLAGIAQPEGQKRIRATFQDMAVKTLDSAASRMGY